MIDRRTLLAAAPLFACPASLLAADRPPLVGRIALDGGRLYTAVRINGEELLFIIDTGAAQNLIRPEVAARLKLAGVASGTIGGLGAKTRMTPIHTARDVVIGGIARQREMLFRSYDFGPALRRDAAGLLAAGVLTSYATTLDFAKGQWSLYLDGLPPLEGFRPLPGRITREQGEASERIYVDATLDGKPLRLMVDTGAPRNLLLFPHASTRFKSFAEGRTFTETAVSGFGGRSRYPARYLKPGALKIGAFLFEDIGYVAMDPREPRKGFGADGILGINLIGLFDWAIDPRGDKLLVRRNALPFAERPPTPVR